MKDQVSGPGAGDILLAVVGDVHGEFYHLKKIIDYLSDLAISGVLLVGDFGSPSYEQRRWHQKDAAMSVLFKEASTIFDLLGTLGVPIVWVPGDHDGKDLDLPGNCDRNVAVLDGVRIYGIGGAGPRRADFPYEWDEAEVRQLRIPPCEILLTHTPPARTPLDKMFHSQVHVGSEAVREIAEKHLGALVCGHVHEASGTFMIDRCLCLNAGSLGDPYGSIQVGLVVVDRESKTCLAVEHRNLLANTRRTLRR